MSEFYIMCSNLKHQQMRLINVANSVKGCLKLVENANQGLGAIGLGELSPALDSIVYSLSKHNTRCEGIADALARITNQYQQAENVIASGKSAVVMFQEMLDSIRDVTKNAFDPYEGDPLPDEVTDDRPNQDALRYVGAMYLIGNERAFKQGHAALVLVYIGTDGEYHYEYYSYYSDFIYLRPGQVGTNMDYDFDGDGIIDTSIDDTTYSNYIYIPIDDQQGVDMSRAAYDLIQNPGQYSLTGNNCNMNVQRIFQEGDIDFALDEFDFVATRPNTVYENYMALLQEHPENYPGYRIGEIDGNDITTCFSQPGWLENIADQSTWDVSDISDATFTDPTEWLEQGLNGFSIITFGGTTAEEVAMHSNLIYNTANFLIDGSQYATNYFVDTNQAYTNFMIDQTQSYVNTGVDVVQGYSNSIIDNTQAYVNTAIDASQTVTNATIDASQYMTNLGIDQLQQQYVSNPWLNTIIDGAQGAYNGVTDLGQSAYNGITDFGQDAYNGITDFGQEAYNGITDFGQEAYNGIVDFGQEAYNGITDFGQDLYNGAVDGIQSIGEGIANSPVGHFFGLS